MQVSFPQQAATQMPCPFNNVDAQSGHCLKTKTHKVPSYIPMLCTLQLTIAHVHAWACLATMSNLSTLSQIAHSLSENVVCLSVTN